jgi:hypothetical protein
MKNQQASAIKRAARASLYFVMFLVLSGCQAMQQDFANYGKNYKDVPVQTLTKGDSKDQVMAMLDAPVRVVGSKVFDQSTVVVWEYEKWHASTGSDMVEQRYWLYFLDGVYQKWTSPTDWGDEANRIYASGTNN